MMAQTVGPQAVTETGTGIAVVHFRTHCAGSYWLKPGMRRGHWRVLLVRVEARRYAITDKNVLQEIYRGDDGIAGVTPRSAYYIGHDHDRAVEIAAGWNQTALAGAGPR